jgi:hypothetical protein
VYGLGQLTAGVVHGVGGIGEDGPVTERTTTDAASGWYPDPWKAGQQRFWDGSRWTSDVFQHAFDLPAGPAASPAALGPAPTQPAAAPPPPPDFGSRAPTAPLPAWAPPPEVLETPAPRRNRALIVTAALVAAVLVLSALAVAAFRPTDRAVAQVSPTPTPSPTAPARPSPTPSPSSPSSPAPSSPTQPPGAHSALLQNLVVRQRDVPTTFVVATINGGDQVQGQATLDLCDAAYPSESLRLERLQTAAFDQQQVANLSTEAVLYRSADATAAAFREVAQVAGTCPTTGTTDPVTGAQTTTTFGPAPDGAWPRTPGVDRQAYSVTTTDDTGTSRTSTVVYLKRGPILLGVYFIDASAKPVPVEGRTTVPAIVQVFEKRLLNPPTGGSGGSGIPGVTA